MSTAAHVTRCLMTVILIAPLLAAAQEKPTVSIAREYIGSDCVAGVLTVDQDFVAFLVALPYRENPPTLAALFPGTYEASLNGSAANGWEIAYTPDGGTGVVRLKLGRAPVAGIDGIAIGDELANNCEFSKHSQYGNAARAFEQHLQFPQSAADDPHPIRLKIEDR